MMELMKHGSVGTGLILVLGTVLTANASVLFYDNFGVSGNRPDTKTWTTEVGASSFLGRTQLADWISAGASGQFVVGSRGAELTLNTYNPTGNSLYGTHGKTQTAFQPTATSTIDFTTKLQLTSLQPGLVYGLYLFGCPGPCATQHDEIDIELVTNSLQPGRTLQVQLNRYSNEPLGAGHGGLVSLPAGFDPLAVHEWTIRWSLSRIDYLVDGVLLGSSTTFVPRGPMQVNEIAWGPGPEWSAAYSPALQPVTQKLQNQAFTAHLMSVTVSEVSSPTSFSVASAGPATLEVDTRHTSGNKFDFVIANNASVLDYITIQRSLVRSNGQAVLGVPSPEYGVSVVAGGTARMWFRWDLIGRVNPGSYTATIPFKSELTQQTVNRDVTIVVKAATTESRSAVRGTIRGADGTSLANATITLTDTGIGNDDGTNTPPVASNGAFSANLVPGDYALTADAAGHEAKTLYFNVAGGRAVDLAFVLDPVSVRVDSTKVTATITNVTSSVWTMRASGDGRVASTAPMSSGEPSAFHGLRDGAEVWKSAFPGIGSRGGVSQFQATDCDVTVSADGATVVGMDYGGTLYVIEAATGAIRWSTNRNTDRNPKYPPNSGLGQGFYTCGAVAISDDGSSLAAGGSNGWLVMFEAKTGSVRWSQGYSAEIRALRFTPDGSRVAVGAGDWKFRMLDAKTGGAVWDATNQFWPLFFVAMNGTGTLVGTGSKEAEFRLWDAGTGALKWMKSYPYGNFVSGAAVASSVNQVVVSDWGIGVHGYDAAGADLWLRKLTNAGLAATADGKYFLTAGYSVTGNRVPVIYLLNDKGTVLWQNFPDMTKYCKVSAPFASDFIKSVAISSTPAADGATLRATAACIGGTVFSFEIPVTGSGGGPRVTNVINAASGERGGGAPNSWMAVLGENLAAQTAIATGEPFPETLGATQVLVGTTPAPLLYVSPAQINFLMPGVSGGATTLTVSHATTGKNSDPVPLVVADAMPGVFLSGGLAIVQDENGRTLTSSEEGAQMNRLYVLYGTGFGPVNPAVRVNEAPTGAARVTGETHLWLGDVEAEILYVGVTPGVVGLYQVNFRNRLGSGELRTVTGRLAIGGREVNFPVSVQ